MAVRALRFVSQRYRILVACFGNSVQPLHAARGCIEPLLIRSCRALLAFATKLQIPDLIVALTDNVGQKPSASCVVWRRSTTSLEVVG
jgi:hypothetical protein